MTRAQTIFEIGSITKAFTGLLLAEIALAGIVDIDDPLDTYLPNGVWPPARDAPISLAELASQSADQASMSERTGGSWQCANRPVLIAARIEL